MGYNANGKAHGPRGRPLVKLDLKVPRALNPRELNYTYVHIARHFHYK